MIERIIYELLHQSSERQPYIPFSSRTSATSSLTLKGQGLHLCLTSPRVMATDDVPEDYASSLELNSIEIKQIGDGLSAEDIAWADSCLIKYSGSHNGWESVRDALLDVLDSHSDSAKSEKHNNHNGAEAEMISTSEVTDTAASWDKFVDSNASTSGKLDPINDGYLITENRDSFGTSFNFENVFLPTYNESLRGVGTLDSEYDSSFPAFETDEQSPIDIFKVWELESPPEDDELIKQLNKALSESSLEPLPLVSDVSGVSNDLKELDDLIYGIADLSLI